MFFRKSFLGVGGLHCSGSSAFLLTSCVCASPLNFAMARKRSEGSSFATPKLHEIALNILSFEARCVQQVP